MDFWLEANRFLFDMKVGDKYKVASDSYVECIRRTPKKIYLSNGKIIHLRKIKNYTYLTSKSNVRNNRSYDGINQILRDVEGYLVYKRLTDKSYQN